MDGFMKNTKTLCQGVIALIDSNSFEDIYYTIQ